MQSGRPSVDLNADVGESFGRWTLGDDEALLAVVTSANVACGFHAGDPLTLRRTCAEAVRRGVRIGAQVGYRDLAGFGRRFMEVPADELAADVLYQLGALDGIARAAGGRVAYLKPHGALYNAIVTHQAQARAVVEAVLAFQDGHGVALPVLGLPGSSFLELAAQAGLPVVPEGFADRAYRPDGTLAPRSEPGAVLTDPRAVAAQAVRLAGSGTVGSICVHGDSPDAAVLATAVRAGLAGGGFTVRAFA
ncbi:LamB/YcsF family protein [Nocardioides stalactiti]|uniref:LamB/YcsF family protein n=1 Tax=Nocardioides stalactiti TaxID=2755356 RepID=UPI001600FE4A|nr:5-oxoprolinase subunit PxpA [Nocardioides stalactiti]